MNNGINTIWLIYLNNYGENETIANYAVFFAKYAILIIPIFLVANWIYYAYKKYDYEKKNLLLIFYSCVIGIIFALIIQQFFSLPEANINGIRPEEFLKNNKGIILFEHDADKPFPSDHATVGFAFLTALLLLRYYKSFWFCLILVLFMTTGRVVSGVHWPLDVIGGIITGIIAGIVTIKLIGKFKIVNKFNNFIIKIASYFKL